jgi:hypothetical protein
VTTVINKPDGKPATEIELGVTYTVVTTPPTAGWTYFGTAIGQAYPVNPTALNYGSGTFTATSLGAPGTSLELRDGSWTGPVLVAVPWHDPRVPATGHDGTDWTPAGSRPPSNKTELDAITPTITTIFKVAVGGTDYWWTGTAWSATQPVATGYDGTNWTPAGSRPPSNKTELDGVTPTPATAWASDQFVIVGGAWYKWDGSAWTAITAGHWDYSHGIRWVGPFPMTVPTLAEQTQYGPIVQISPGEDHGYALTADGHIIHFGSNSVGQRNDIPTAGGFVQVTAGYGHGYALTADGHIVEFGDHTRDQRQDLPATGGFVQVVATRNGGYALTADGHIVAFGEDTGKERANLPASGGFVQLSAGQTMGYALTADGHIVMLGYGFYGPDQDLPTTGGFVQVAAGYYHGYALTPDGHVVAFGDSHFSQRADLPAGGGFVRVVAGQKHGYALTPDGHVVAFGNTSDQERKDLPAGGGFVQLSSGQMSGYALTPDGHVVAFGSDMWAQRDYLPLFPAWFDQHPYTADASRVVTVHVISDIPPSKYPYVIDWGDGTAPTPVPVGTADGTTFTHAYAAAGDYTVHLHAPAITTDTDSAVAHVNRAVRPQYVFTYDGARFQFSEVKTWDGASFKDSTVKVFDGTNWVD